MFGSIKISLRTRLCLGVFLASIIPCLIGGAYLVELVLDRIHNSYLKQARSAIVMVQSELDHALLTPAENLVGTLAHDERLALVTPGELNYYRSGADFVDHGLPQDNALRRRFDNLKEHHAHIGSIFFAATDGGYLETPPFTPNISYDPRERAWYKNTIAQRGHVVTSDPYVTAISGRMVVSVTHTVENDYETRGIVGIMLPLTEFQNKVLETTIGETGHLMILNPNERIVVSPKHPEWLLKTPQEIDLPELSSLVEQPDALLPLKAFGKEQLLLVGPPDRRGWKVLALIDRQELVAQAAPLRNTIIAVYTLTLLMVLLTIIYAATRITRPLRKMTESATRMATGDLNKTEIQVSTNDELGQLAKSFSLMAKNLKQSYSELELRVEERTQDLNAANEELQAMNEELSDTITQLHQTQELLVKTEKLAALSGLVAGVAHEINTPAGVALTAASHLDAITKELSALYAVNGVKRSHLSEYVAEAQQATNHILTNLQKTIRLVRSFKQVSVNQTNEMRHLFNVRECLEDAVACFTDRLAKSRIEVNIDCPDDLLLNSFPDSLRQIISNLLANSLLHAYKPDEKGLIVISAAKERSGIRLCYYDDGRGMEEGVLAKMYEPFFTTNRATGSLGLGMAVIYNIIAVQFGGMIDCASTPGEGVKFTITLPENPDLNA